MRSTECWKTEHIIHCSVAIVNGFLFISFCLLSQLVYFESSKKNDELTAKSNSRSDVFIMLTKIVTILTFSLLHGAIYNEFLVIVCFILSIMLWFNFYIDQPYFNKFFMKTQLAIWGVYLWNCIIFFIAMLFKNSEYDGFIYIFFMGIPVIVLIIWYESENKLETIHLNIDKLNSDKAVIWKMDNLISIIDDRNEKREYQIILYGYMETHLNFCFKQKCNLRNYKESLENNNEQIILLYQHIRNEFIKAITKFPDSCLLRIRYALFLLDYLNLRETALFELEQANTLSPSFDQQFIIYRNIRLINENDLCSLSSSNIDVISSITYKNHFSQCLLLISQNRN